MGSASSKRNPRLNTRSSARSDTTDAHLTSLIVNLATFRTEAILTDVVLRGSDSRDDIPCHRVVLAAASEYFKVMFTCGMKEQKTNSVTLPTISHHTLQTVVTYIYSGHVPLIESTVLSVLGASHLLGLTSLSELCCTFMGDSVSKKNVAEYYEHLTLYEMTNTEVEDFIHTKFNVIVADGTFLAWSFDLTKRLLSDDKIAICEDAIFECVTRWISHNESDLDESQVEDLLGCVKLEEISSEYLSDAVYKHPLMKTEMQAKRVSRAMANLIKHKTGRTSSKVRGVPQCIIVLSADLKLLAWQQNTNTWNVLTEVPRECRVGYIILCAARGIIIIRDEQKVFMMYEIQHTVWKRLADSPVLRKCGGVLILGDELYILGGLSCTNDAQFDCYSLNVKLPSSTWVKRCNLPCPTKFLGQTMVSMNNMIYVCGSLGADKKLQEYNVVTDSWRLRADLPRDCSTPSGGAVTHNNKVYVLQRDNCMIYTPGDDSWCTVTYPPIGECISRPVVVDNKIVLLAGPTREEMLLHSFNEEQIKWQRFSDARINVSLHSHQLVSA